jgi:hypothetical protein
MNEFIAWLIIANLLFIAGGLMFTAYLIFQALRQ